MVGRDASLARAAGWQQGAWAQQAALVSTVSRQDHSRDPIGVACTLAHEMGHNLGMNHDENVPGCRCPASPGSGKCVMAASVRCGLAPACGRAEGARRAGVLGCGWPACRPPCP